MTRKQRPTATHFFSSVADLDAHLLPDANTQYLAAPYGSSDARGLHAARLSHSVQVTQSSHSVDIRICGPRYDSHGELRDHVVRNRSRRQSCELC